MTARPRLIAPDFMFPSQNIPDSCVPAPFLFLQETIAIYRLVEVSSRLKSNRWHKSSGRKIGAEKIDARHSGLSEIRAAEISPAQQCTREVGLLKRSELQFGSRKVGIAQVGVVQPCGLKDRMNQPHGLISHVGSQVGA